GVVLSTIIFGITISQGWIYVNTNHDTWHLRLLVAVIILLDFTTTCLNCQSMRYYLMSNYGDLKGLLTLPPSMAAVIVVSIPIIYLFVFQLFFASRIYLRV
ncbi:hypothetical protein L208DRAFT_1384838, partial [Tricholoma matsutake]